MIHAALTYGGEASSLVLLQCLRDLNITRVVEDVERDRLVVHNSDGELEHVADGRNKRVGKYNAHRLGGPLLVERLPASVSYKRANEVILSDALRHPVLAPALHSSYSRARH